VDVRVVAATNRDLRTEIEAGRFREDLYYRLSVFPIDVIPLRQRIDDIPLLADLFLQRSCSRLGVPPLKLKKRHVELMQGYSWPGNIRELQNVIERAVIRAQRGTLDFELPAATNEKKTVATVSGFVEKPNRILRQDEMKRMERENIIAALEATHWQLSGSNGAAALLGLRPTTLASRIKALELKRS
jgi:transcriptional regulator with GAF, ATPase, and Fis domain